MAVWSDSTHGKCSYGHFEMLISGKYDMFEKKHMSCYCFLDYICWIWFYGNVPMDCGIILGVRRKVRFDLIFTCDIPLFQEHIVFQMIVYLQSSIMPKGSPSPVHLCRSCLRRFGDLKKNMPLDFWNMYFVDFVVFCDFELSCILRHEGSIHGGRQKHSGGTQEASRRHPVGTQEAQGSRGL